MIHLPPHNSLFPLNIIIWCNMANIRSTSSLPSFTYSTSNNEQPQECGSEGLATNVKLLLKLIQEHNGAGTKENHERQIHRMNGMMLMLEEVRSRIQRIQSSTKRKAELRRCNTDVRPNIPAPKDRRLHDVPMDDKERLRRELNASMIARQSLQAMCSSLGKEKQIMASELSRKAQEMAEMEEFISDLKAQNDMLMEKLQAYSSEQKEKSNGMEMEGGAALQQRNKMLSEQLKRSLDAYRSLKRVVRESEEENHEIHDTMEEMKVDVQAGIDRIHGLKEEMVTESQETNNVKEGISALEQLLEALSMKLSKHTQKKSCIISQKINL